MLAIISARGGSKEVFRKNVLQFSGIPLVGHMFLKALKCPEISKVVCSTDDDEIASIAKDFGVDVPFRRPPELAEIEFHLFLQRSTVCSQWIS